MINYSDIVKPASSAMPSDITIFPSLASVPPTFTGPALVANVPAAFIDGWLVVPAIFRLILSGTGTATISAKDSSGTVTVLSPVYTLPADASVKNFEAGDTASIQLALTGSAVVEYLG